MGIRELTPELAEKAKNELNEDPARIPQDLQHIKDWLAKQPHLNARTDDQWLIAFLRGCKYSLEKTKKKLDTFYTLRGTFPEVTANKDPLDPITQDILNFGVMVPLLKLPDPLFPRVLLMRIGVCDPDKYTMLDMMKVTQMIADIQMLEDDAEIISGRIMVVDMKKVGLGLMIQMTPLVGKKLVVLGEEATPIRQKGAHHFNVPASFERVFNAIKPLMSEKLQKRIYFHNDMETLYKHIPKSIFPKEYGGDAGPMQDIIDEWKVKLESYRDWFLDDAKYGTDESKRVGSPRTTESMFGVEGSFRQLEFD